jgi:hypothetical protein
MTIKSNTGEKGVEFGQERLTSKTTQTNDNESLVPLGATFKPDFRDCHQIVPVGNPTGGNVPTIRPSPCGKIAPLTLEDIVPNPKKFRRVGSKCE